MVINPLYLDSYFTCSCMPPTSQVLFLIGTFFSSVSYSTALLDRLTFVLSLNTTSHICKGTGSALEYFVIFVQNRKMTYCVCNM